MTAHASCTHENTKAARAKCRAGLSRRIDEAIAAGEAKRDRVGEAVSRRTKRAETIAAGTKRTTQAASEIARAQARAKSEGRHCDVCGKRAGWINRPTADAGALIVCSTHLSDDPNGYVVIPL